MELIRNKEALRLEENELRLRIAALSVEQKKGCTTHKSYNKLKTQTPMRH